MPKPGDALESSDQDTYDSLTVSEKHEQYPYPRRRLVRWVLQRLARVALRTLADVRVTGRENLPETGPLLVVANHFHTLDTATIVATMPWPLEFLGGFQLVDAPNWITWLPKTWGFYPVRRGAVSRTAFHAARAVMAQDGILGIFPEGGSWANVLRTPRPGTAYLAAQTGARLLPLGLDGLIDVFPSLQTGRRATVTVRIGQPFGPFAVTARGRAARPQLQAMGNVLMEHIAELLPPERRGVYSDDPFLREAAAEAAIYPYAELNRNVRI